MNKSFKFNRLELSGSLGDLGTLIPMSMGMILINGLNPQGLFLTVGLFYIFSGIYFKVTMPVQPMKVIAAYAIAAGIGSDKIIGSALIMGLILLFLGGTGAIKYIKKYTPLSVIRGVQLSTGAILMVKGLKLMIGSSSIQILRQIAEPYLIIQNLGPIPIGIIIGFIGAAAVLFLLNSKKVPPGLAVIAGGILIGAIIGTHNGFDRFSIGLYIPRLFPFAFPDYFDFTYALFAIVLPQLPMTIGNAVIANADLSARYFGKESKKVTERGLCISMALANIASFVFGGMPMCHGAGGLAAHYRFGARSAGSNLIIGAIFTCLAIFTGFHILSILFLIPMSVLGILLFFAGAELSMTIIDIKEKKDIFVAAIMLGITLAINLGAGFALGITTAYILKLRKITL